MTTRLSEFRLNARTLAAASLGLSAGMVVNYLNSLFGPHLIAAFGWTKADFALIGLTILAAAVCLPVAGRFVDRIGARRMAGIGIVALPAIFLAMSAMNGNFALYFVLCVLQVIVVSCFVGLLTYGRFVAAAFDRSRGLALSIASSSPPLLAAVTSPILSAIIDLYGWRAGYVSLAAFLAIGGATALALIPRQVAPTAPSTGADQGGTSGSLLRDRTLWLLLAGMFACNLYYTVQTAQLRVVLLEQGVESQAAIALISLAAVGVIVGRIACGFALDWWRLNVVAALCFVIPGIGLAMLAAGVEDFFLVGIAVFSLGFSMGAEGDLVVYLVSRLFPPPAFGLALGLLTGMVACSAAAGALLLSLTLSLTSDYRAFFAITAVLTLGGSLLFLVIPQQIRQRQASPSRFPPTTENNPS